MENHAHPDSSGLHRARSRRLVRRLGQLVLALACVAAGIWYCWNYVWLPSGTSTISMFHAEEAFHPCSRSAPVHDDGRFWLPTASDLEWPEAALEGYLDRRNRAGLDVPPRFAQFHRQYIGFYRNGKPLIYLAAFPSGVSFGSHRWELFETPLLMCDGGSHMWGAVYDPELQSFIEFESNGP